MWCVSGRLAGFPFGRSALLGSHLGGAQLRQSDGRSAGLHKGRSASWALLVGRAQLRQI